MEELKPARVAILVGGNSNANTLFMPWDPSGAIKFLKKEMLSCFIQQYSTL
jgi:hypothetical protein